MAKKQRKERHIWERWRRENNKFSIPTLIWPTKIFTKEECNMTDEIEEKVEYIDHQEVTNEAEEEMPYLSDDVVIDATNFKDYFFDVKNFKPKRGQIMAKYSAMAELIKGEEKKMLIKLLAAPDKARAASAFMKKIMLATEADSMRVPIEMATDLASGMDERKVLNKIYKFQVEAFFYTWPECVPQNDPHWQCITIKDLTQDVIDDFLRDSIKNSEETINAEVEES